MTPDIAETLELAKQAHRQGRLDDARGQYRSVLDKAPGHPNANYNLGVLEASQTGPDAALPFFKKALEANPKHRPFWIAYVEALIAAGHTDSARAVLDKGISKGLSGDDVVALDHLLAQAQGRRAPGEEDLQLILDHFQSGRLDDAGALAASVVREHPQHLFCWQILAAVYHVTGRKHDALAANRKLVAIAPYDAEAQSNLGNTLLELGNLKEAEESFRKSIALNGRLAEVHNNLAVTLLELGRPDEAENEYRTAISLNPDYAEAHSNLGNLLKELGRIDEAEECHTKAIAANPEYVPAHQNRGQIFFDKGRFEDAIRDFEVCNTEDSRARILSCLYALGRIDDIYETIKAQSEIDRKNIRVAAFSAFIAEQKGLETANNFCPTPLDYIHITNLAAHVEEPGPLISNIITELQDIGSTWEPRNRSTRKGFQSKVNLFVNPPKNIGALKDIIIREIDTYRAKHRDDDCAFIQEWPADYSFRSWYVILKQQGHQDQHIHPSGWLSGVVYLRVVPDLGNDEGAIQFDLNGETYTDPRSPNLTYRPNLGDIVFFPSSLHHRTIPFTTDTDRIIISFDLRPN
jgi:tetratricopeptide (TPR) repeat protein